MFSALEAWKRPLQRYSRLLDGAVCLALAALVLYTVSKHEPLADEAQAWLLARDFSFLKLVLSELRYEGHPALWYAILALAIHVFHLPYAYFGYLGGSLALCGLGVLVFLAPFPRLLRYLIAFSFFFVYQYAVIARPYVLMPLLGFLAAHFYRQGLRRITAFAVATALLIQVSSYAAVVAFALTASYASNCSRAGKRFPPKIASELSLPALFSLLGDVLCRRPLSSTRFVFGRRSHRSNSSASPAAYGRSADRRSSQFRARGDSVAGPDGPKTPAPLVPSFFHNSLFTRHPSSPVCPCSRR